MACTICLESATDGSGAVLNKGCCCRGDNAKVHTSCLVEFARHATETREDGAAWYRCSTCNEVYTGAVRLELAQTWASRCPMDGQGPDDAPERACDEKFEAASNLANTQLTIGQPAKAEAIYAKLFAALKAAKGEWSEEAIVAADGLSIALCEQGKTSDALAIQQRIYDRQLAHLGPNHCDTLRAMVSLSNTYNIIEKHCEAEELRRKILTAREETQGPEHPLTLDAICNLAISCDQLGKMDEAIELEERLYSTSQRVCGREHPMTLSSGANLAGSYLEVGRVDSARALVESILPVQTKVCGAGHPDTVFTKAVMDCANVSTRRNCDPDSAKLCLA
eukprot:m.34389 g.34389  ORF g.34389 m.34389 type:complete len:336 (+) comp7315_c0_seq1:227-1234(+)